MRLFGGGPSIAVSAPLPWGVYTAALLGLAERLPLLREGSRSSFFLVRGTLLIFNAFQESNDEAEELVASLVDSIRRRGLASPAAVLLEALSPVSFVLGQLLILLEPLASPLLGRDGQRYIVLFADRHSLRTLLRALEADPSRLAE